MARVLGCEVDRVPARCRRRRKTFQRNGKHSNARQGESGCGVGAMIRRSKPLKRSWLRPKKRVRRVSWRSGRIREDSKGMARLRSEAFSRSNGVCECARKACEERPLSERIVTWRSGQLHHVISRGRGGSDVIENVRFITRRCHEEIHGIPQWAYKGRKGKP